MPKDIFPIEDPILYKNYKMMIYEMNQAAAKHPVWPDSPVERAAIVAEEAGEVIREANHIREGHGNVYALQYELIQLAGTCFRMLHLMHKKGEV